MLEMVVRVRVASVMPRGPGERGKIIGARNSWGPRWSEPDEEGRMGVRLRDVLARQLDRVRYEPVTRRVRAEVDGTVVVDSDRAVLVWEPRRVVPTYAVPV